MSLRDDSMPPPGRFQKGHKGSNQYTKTKQLNPTPDTDASFDDDLIAAANSYGQPRTKTGRRAWCEALRDQKPTEYAQLLTKALARKAEAATNPDAYRPITVEILPCPENYFIPAEQAGIAFEKRTGMTLTTKEPPPPSRPVLVASSDKPAFPELDDNEIMFGGVDHDDDA